MALLLSLLALAMIATGGAAMVFGAPIVQVERGWTMVIAGSMFASSGAVLLGMSLASQRLGRIAREMLVVRDRLAQIEELTAMRLDAVAAQAPIATSPQTVYAPGEPDLPPPEPADPTKVVGQYSSGGNSYTMFADGSIRAVTPAGERRFGSLEELRSFVAAGGRATVRRGLSLYELAAVQPAATAWSAKA